MTDKKTEPVFTEKVDNWAIFTRHNGTHYASWAENSSFETFATIDEGCLITTRKEKSKHTSVPLVVVARLIELEASRLMTQKLNEQLALEMGS